MNGEGIICICGKPEYKGSCPLQNFPTHCKECGMRKEMYRDADKKKKKMCGNRRCDNFGKK